MPGDLEIRLAREEMIKREPLICQNLSHHAVTELALAALIGAEAARRFEEDQITHIVMPDALLNGKRE